MTRFNRYMQNINAEESLKQKTIERVNKALAAKQSNKKEEHFKMRKLLIAACITLAVLGLGAGGYIYYQTPVNYVSLDINPSIELGINAFDTVVCAEAANEDGENVLEGQDIEGLPVEEAIDALVQEAADQGFVAEDGSTVIAVTAESDDEEKALELQEKSANGVSLAMSTKNMFAAVYKDCSDLELRTQAKELGVSPGKYKLIMMLQTLDPTVNPEDYKDAKVNEIMKKANEMLQVQNSGEEQNIEEQNQAQNGETEQEQIANKIKDTAEQVKQAQEKAKEKQDKEDKENQDNGNKNGQSEGNGKKATATPAASTDEPNVTATASTTTEPEVTAAPATEKPSATEKGNSGNGNEGNNGNGKG